MKKTLIITLSLFLVTLAFLGGGCAAALVGAGAGTVAYIRGDLEAMLDENIDSAYHASLPRQHMT